MHDFFSTTRTVPLSAYHNRWLATVLLYIPDLNIVFASRRSNRAHDRSFTDETINVHGKHGMEDKDEMSRVIRETRTPGRTEPLQQKCNSDFGRHSWEWTRWRQTSVTTDARLAIVGNKWRQLGAARRAGGCWCRAARRRGKWGMTGASAPTS